MLKCDVLVVGSGASGSVASLMLSKAGYNVLTIDSASKFGGRANKRIDVTESELPDGSKLDPIMRELKIRPLKRFNTSLWKSKNESFILKSDASDFYLKRGCTPESLEFQLMKNAIDSGCEFLPSTLVSGFSYNDDRIAEVSLKNKGRKIVVKPDVIVGADGSFSTCRKLAKIRETSHCLESFGAMIRGKAFNGTQVLFDYDFAPGGFVYSGNAGKESFVGIMQDRSVSGKSSKYFFEINKSRNAFMHLVRKNYITNFFGGIEKYGDVERLVDRNLILVGGAGLLIDPFLGYGSNHAIFSAYKASKAIINGMDLKSYEKSYQEIIRYFEQSKKARHIFNALDNKDIDFVIRSLKAVTDRRRDTNHLLSILKSKPTSLNALRILHVFSKILA
jgi:flavin-dependent dehydrogenase